jgi:precorrin-6Y C5,15-methyltransferase (decarboxylating)
MTASSARPPASGARPPITVIGMGPSPLGGRAARRLAEATLVAGARRHLAAAGLAAPDRAPPHETHPPRTLEPSGAAPGRAALPNHDGVNQALTPGTPAPDRPASAPRPQIDVSGAPAPRVPAPDRPAPGPRIVELTGDLEPALAALADAGGRKVVLASGDPGFFGVVRVLAERFGRHRLEVIPSVSTVAAAFAAAGLPWDDALVVTAHGRDPEPAVHACLAHPKVAVLTQPGFGPAELAARLGGSGRRLVVAERLGEPDERVVEGEPAAIGTGRWADPNVVLVLDERRAIPAGKGRAWPARRAPTRWAMPEATFEHRDGMITKAEVRALALARLGPGLGDLVWDVGAGSGSVGVECARFGAAVIAVDRDPLACKLVAANAGRHQVDVRVVVGTAPEALAGLPDPDAVFVGGSGGALAAILQLVATRARRAVVVALSGADRHTRPERVLLAAQSLAAAGMEVDTVRLHASRFETTAGLRESRPINPVYLISGVRP